MQFARCFYKLGDSFSANLLYFVVIKVFVGREGLNKFSTMIIGLQMSSRLEEF